jgi:hypothetical protein
VVDDLATILRKGS